MCLFGSYSFVEFERSSICFILSCLGLKHSLLHKTSLKSFSLCIFELSHMKLLRRTKELEGMLLFVIGNLKNERGSDVVIEEGWKILSLCDCTSLILIVFDQLIIRNNYLDVIVVLKLNISINCTMRWARFMQLNAAISKSAWTRWTICHQTWQCNTQHCRLFHTSDDREWMEADWNVSSELHTEQTEFGLLKMLSRRWDMSIM